MHQPDWHTPNTADPAVRSIIKGSVRNVTVGESYYMVTTNAPMDKYMVMHGDVINIDGREVSWVETGEDPRDFVFARNEKAQEVAENTTVILQRQTDTISKIADSKDDIQPAAESDGDEAGVPSLPREGIA